MLIGNYDDNSFNLYHSRTKKKKTMKQSESEKNVLEFGVGLLILQINFW
jgi:hypothetical protein